MITDTEKYIQSRLSTAELLCQLAEEAGELTQAALKLRRALEGINPTPTPSAAATDSLIEELADVILVARLLLFPDQLDRTKEIGRQKAARWAARLRAAKSNDRSYEVTEVCPHCESEVTMVWDTDKDGFEAFCPYCGNRLMLCDECQHTENPVACDYCNETDSCQMRKEKK